MPHTPLSLTCLRYLARQIRLIPKKVISAIAGIKPSFRATQLIPTTGNKLMRTMVRTLACWAMNLGLQVDAEILDKFLECDKGVPFELILIQPWKSR